MNERQLLTEIRLQQNKSTTPLQLMTEREFRYFLFHLLDKPREFGDFINTLSPYKYSEMIKLEQQSRGESAFAKILRIYTEGENPLSISTPLTMAERRSFILDLIPESLQTTRSQISKMNLSKEVFESFAQTFGYYHNLSIENENLADRIKEVVSLKRGAPAPVESLLTTARSIPTPTPRLSSRSTPISFNTSSAMTIQRSIAMSTTDFRDTSKRSWTAKTRKIEVERKLQVERKAKTVKIKSRDVLKPSVASLVKAIDLEEARTMSIEELNNIIQDREKQIIHNKQEAATLSQKITCLKRDCINLEDEISSLESQYESYLAAAEQRKQEEEQEKIHTSRMYSSRRREANEITHQLQEAIEENKKLKKQLSGLQ